LWRLTLLAPVGCIRQLWTRMRSAPHVSPTLPCTLISLRLNAATFPALGASLILRPVKTLGGGWTASPHDASAIAGVTR
jgi:hypothetical protein